MSKEGHDIRAETDQRDHREAREERALYQPLTPIESRLGGGIRTRGNRRRESWRQRIVLGFTKGSGNEVVQHLVGVAMGSFCHPRFSRIVCNRTRNAARARNRWLLTVPSGVCITSAISPIDISSK